MAFFCFSPTTGLQNPIDTMYHLQPLMFMGLFPLFLFNEGLYETFVPVICSVFNYVVLPQYDILQSPVNHKLWCSVRVCACACKQGSVWVQQRRCFG